MHAVENFAGPVLFFGFVLVGAALAIYGMQMKTDVVPFEE